MAEYLRVNHTSPKNLQPAGLFADPATGAATDHAGDIDFCRGFSKWKEAGAQPDPGLLPEQLIGKGGQYPLQVSKGNLGIHHKTFDLMKHGGVGGI